MYTMLWLYLTGTAYVFVVYSYGGARWWWGQSVLQGTLCWKRHCPGRVYSTYSLPFNPQESHIWCFSVWPAKIYMGLILFNSSLYSTGMSEKNGSCSMAVLCPQKRKLNCIVSWSFCEFWSYYWYITGVSQKVKLCLKRNNLFSAEWGCHQP